MYVPNLTAIDASDGSLCLVLDKRFAFNVDKDRATDFIWFLAQALSIGAGYPGWEVYCESFSAAPKPLNEIIRDIVKSSKQAQAARQTNVKPIPKDTVIKIDSKRPWDLPNPMYEVTELK